MFQGIMYDFCTAKCTKNRQEIMVNFTLKDFNERLHHTLLCSNNLENGTKLRKKSYALAYDYIQFNDFYIKFLVLDLDRPLSAMDWYDLNLPAPHFVVKNPENSHCHYVYALSMPICRTDNARLKPLEYFAKIQQAYTHALRADQNFAGLLTKNPNSETWNVTQWATKPYSLDYLADFVDLPQKLLKREVIGEGRNCYLFNVVRKFAYKEILFYKSNGANQTDFYNVILAKLEKLNVFQNSQSLDFKELTHIAKSISRWTWRNFTVEKFSKIQTARSKKAVSIRWGKNSKQKRIEILWGEI